MTTSEVLCQLFGLINVRCVILYPLHNTIDTVYCALLPLILLMVSLTVLLHAVRLEIASHAVFALPQYGKNAPEWLRILEPEQILLPSYVH